MGDKPVKLTSKQELFCKEYLIDLNATQAAIRAGYKEDNAKQMGCENLAKPDLAERIAELQEERSKRTLITADEVIRGLIEVKDRCMQAEPVMVRENGEMVPNGEYKFEHSGANKSLELLGRHLKLFTDVTENRVGLIDKSDDELKRIIRDSL